MPSAKKALDAREDSLSLRSHSEVTQKSHPMTSAKKPRRTRGARRGDRNTKEEPPLLYRRIAGDKPIPPAFAKAVKIFNELAHDYNLAT